MRHFPSIHLPHLVDYHVTSAATETYNCAAWAFGDNSRWWWPGDPTMYWPYPEDYSTVAAFRRLLEDTNWSESSHWDLEAEFEKIAIYGVDGEALHVARQLSDGRWTSKLGDGIDISHQLAELQGGIYGNVICVYRRHISQIAPDK